MGRACGWYVVEQNVFSNFVEKPDWMGFNLTSGDNIKINLKE
jgi:hypothetical protein